jgi:hypothetical protein
VSARGIEEDWGLVDLVDDGGVDRVSLEGEFRSNARLGRSVNRDCIHPSIQATSTSHHQPNPNPTRSGAGSLVMMPIGVPKVAYRVPGSASADWVDIYNRLYRERIIFLGQEIDDDYANQIIGVLLVRTCVRVDVRVAMCLRASVCMSVGAVHHHITISLYPRVSNDGVDPLVGRYMYLPICFV